MTPTARRLVVAVALSSLTAAASASAEPDDQKAAAQVLFESGRSLLDQGHFDEACPKFAESQRLDPGLGTMLWLADCYESAGRLASGWAAFKVAAAAAAQRKDGREQVARDRAAALEPRLSRLNITVAPGATVPGLEVHRDGLLVGSAVWGLPVPVDPGVHTIAATAPGHRAWSTTVDIHDEAELRPVTIPVLETGPSQPPVAANGDESGDEKTGAAAASSRSGSTQRVIGIAVAGAGAAGIILGAVASLRAKSTYDESNAGHCNAADQCDAIGKQDRSSAISTAMLATVAMSAGAAALIGGGILDLTAPVGHRTAVAVVPSTNGGVLRLNWTF